MFYRMIFMSLFVFCPIDSAVRLIERTKDSNFNHYDIRATQERSTTIKKLQIKWCSEALAEERSSLDAEHV